jgi:hypothetical protein
MAWEASRVSRSNLWKKAGLKKVGCCAALLAVIAAPQALQAVRAAPEHPQATLPARIAAGKPFAAVCKAGEIADSRPDPAWVGASFAHDNCWAPRMPAALDGATAKREQIVAGMAAEKNYLAQSDVYQKCIADFVAFRKAQADKAQKSADSPLMMIESHRIFVAQENKKKAADQIRVAINAFNEYGSECPDK